jgi:hypothetical protein
MMENTIYTISRPPTDDFTYDIFVDLMRSYKDHGEAYYAWSNPPDMLANFFKNAKFSSPVVFIGVKDLLDSRLEEDFNWWRNRRLLMVEVIRDMLKRQADKKFVLFVSLENLDLDLDEPNLHIIPWGGDWVNQRDGYAKLEPVLDKNFQSKKTFISLNRNCRDHRIVLLSYLFGSGLDQHGHMSYLDDKHKELSTPFLDFIYWEFEQPKHNNIRSRILSGYKKMNRSDQFLIDNYEIYVNSSNDNISNFENRLRGWYRNSFVEIVTESSFAPTPFQITEKTAHAFYGCNFPIILSGCGIIQHLRGLGLDVFDDIVDHGYDLIENPFDRIVTAVEANRRLLTDANYIKQTWTACRSRFERNVEVIREIHSWYEHRTRQKFAKTLELIG